MTREEARGLLMRCEAESYCPHYLQKFNCDGCKQRIALDMAIEALSAEYKHCWNCKHYEPKYNVCHAPEVVKQVISKSAEEYEDYEHATLVDIKEPLKVSVVRCKDCKNNYNTCTNHGINQPMCDFTDRMLKETDFCSRGERREE